MVIAIDALGIPKGDKSQSINISASREGQFQATLSGFLRELSSIQPQVPPRISKLTNSFFPLPPLTSNIFSGSL